MKTRSLLLGAAASLSLASAANATHVNGYYVSLEGGANWIQETDVVFDASASGTMDFDTGWAALGTVGYQWNAWRGELELGYRANNSDAVGGIGPVDGEFNEFSAMFNVLYDLRLSERIGLYFGAGAGADFIQYEDNNLHTIPLTDDDWVFAWQGIAGVNYELTSRTDLFVSYRYFNADNPSFAVPGHSDDFDNVVKHTATIGLRYHFGAPAAEPMVAPPPPPPPSEPAAAPKEYIVFFGHNKSNLTPEAMDVIKQAAAAAKEYGSSTITVVGHADRSGSPKYNQALSTGRAGAVKGALVSEGISGGSISTSAKGESDPMVPTADGVREPQNRRVHINL
ncbi:MAG: OmpA family protein [Alphaproteobacteria bacterium]|nr:OmpA family protein [Alphaproteobacteria bacterium]